MNVKLQFNQNHGGLDVTFKGASIKRPVVLWEFLQMLMAELIFFVLFYYSTISIQLSFPHTMLLKADGII